MSLEKDKHRPFIDNLFGCVDIGECTKIEEQLISSNEKLRALSTRMLRMQEQEHVRLSRELHDEIGQALTVIKLNLQLLGEEIKALPPSAVERLKDTVALVDDTLNNVRREAFSLRPPALDEVGLVAAVHAMSQGFSRRTNIRVESKSILEKRLPPDLETALYRCIQEALTNVGRHAQADKVEIRLEQDSTGLSVMIEDNGKGFAPESIRTSVEQIGLIGMQERVELLGGTLTINSRPGRGTLLNIRVPLPEEEKEASKSNESNPGR
ncbi:MAG: sensor histidine kinase [Bacillota bacterium]